MECSLCFRLESTSAAPLKIRLINVSFSDGVVCSIGGFALRDSTIGLAFPAETAQLSELKPLGVSQLW